jgi:hypothetical protein
MGPPRPRPDRIDLIATVAGVLAALAATWGVKAGLVRFRADEAVEAYTGSWKVDSQTKRRLGRVIERELRSVFAHPHADRAASLWNNAPLWLSDTDLATYQSLRKRMAFASERACACFWDVRSCAQGDIVYGQAELSDDELAVWYRLQARAVLARLDDAPPVPVDERELDAGTGLILRAMTDADRARFNEVTEGRATERADLCFAARALFTGIEKFEPVRQGRFIRALMSDDGGR